MQVLHRPSELVALIRHLSALDQQTLAHDLPAFSFRATEMTNRDIEMNRGGSRCLSLVTLKMVI